MSYSAWWREIGSEEWNQIDSSEPITWTQEIIPINPPAINCELYYVSWAYSATIWRPTQQQTLTDSGTAIGPFRAALINPRIAFFRTSGAGYIQTRFQFNHSGTSGTSCSQGTYLYSSGFKVSGINSTFQTQYITNFIDFNYWPVGSEPLTECKTTFSTGLVITRPDCIEVTTTPPECPCCGDMLPGATRILNRLQGMIA